MSPEQLLLTELFPAQLQAWFGITMALSPLTPLAEPGITKHKWKSSECSEGAQCHGGGLRERDPTPCSHPIQRAGHAALGIFPVGTVPSE